MRIAVAGGGGLGYLLATSIASAENAYDVIVLSRAPRPEYANFDIQVHPVDYMSRESLSYALHGVDLVISTVSGPEQINLIIAAGDGTVRHFVPSEFEGKLNARGRSSGPDPLRPNAMSSQALDLLEHLAREGRMRYTVFSCGILMETFHPSGLGHFNMGSGVGVSDPGDYVLNINTAVATYTHRDASNHRVYICLTSAYDLARFMVAALVLRPSNWPTEYTLRGDRLSLEDVVNTCSSLQNVPFTHHRCNVQDLPGYISNAAQNGDVEQVAFYQRLLATAHGRYDFSRASLNSRIAASSSVDFTPMTFAQWLTQILYHTPTE